MLSSEMNEKKRKSPSPPQRGHHYLATVLLVAKASSMLCGFFFAACMCVCVWPLYLPTTHQHGLTKVSYTIFMIQLDQLATY
jgi:hypothetical protein